MKREGKSQGSEEKRNIEPSICLSKKRRRGWVAAHRTKKEVEKERVSVMKITSKIYGLSHKLMGFSIKEITFSV